MAKIAAELRQPAQDWLMASYQTLMALLEGGFAEAEILVAETRSVGERAQGWNCRRHVRASAVHPSRASKAASTRSWSSYVAQQGSFRPIRSAAARS